jgi:fatty acid desaturase
MTTESRSLPESLHRLGEDLGDLIRAEFRLFKIEATRQARATAAAGVWLAAGAVMGLAAFGAFTALLILVLSVAMVPWLAALIVTGAWAITAFSLLAAGLIKLRSALPIEFDETTRSVKEDIEWIKSGINSAK